ncbi:MAG: type II toxin-antitoxin system VapC family toxin, partial [Chitinophagales bacterium]
DYEIWISQQVIREYLSVITKILIAEPNFNLDDIIISVEKFSNQFFIADETKSTNAILLDLVKAYKITGKNIHDCNIVATMKQYEIKNLLTHNTKDFIKYSPNEINVIDLL